jgi:hypothetical protein
MNNIFDLKETQEIINRLNKLGPESKPQWGKMSVAQMLAHCSVTYEFIYEEDKHPKPGAFMKLILKLLVKNKVVSEKPYKPNNPTAPEFIIKDDKNFPTEKVRLINYIQKTQELGEAHFDGKESRSFGILNRKEWNNMFYKHLDHHLRQFGC